MHYRDYTVLVLSDDTSAPTVTETLELDAKYFHIKQFF